MVDTIESLQPIEPIKPIKKRLGNPLLKKGCKNPYAEKIQATWTKRKIEHSKKLTNKQAVYVTGVLQGMKKKHAALKAGYKESVGTDVIEKSSAVKNALTQALYEIGVDPLAIAQKLKEGINATENKFFSHEGIVKDERIVEDFAVRQKYLRDILEVQGFIRNNNLDTLNIGLIQIPSEISENEWQNKSDNLLNTEDLSSKNDIISTPEENQLNETKI